MCIPWWLRPRLAERAEMEDQWSSVSARCERLPNQSSRFEYMTVARLLRGLRERRVLPQQLDEGWTYEGAVFGTYMGSVAPHRSGADEHRAVLRLSLIHI